MVSGSEAKADEENLREAEVSESVSSSSTSSGETAFSEYRLDGAEVFPERRWFTHEFRVAPLLGLLVPESGLRWNGGEWGTIPLSSNFTTGFMGAYTLYISSYFGIGTFLGWQMDVDYGLTQVVIGFEAEVVPRHFDFESQRDFLEFAVGAGVSNLTMEDTFSAHVMGKVGMNFTQN